MNYLKLTLLTLAICSQNQSFAQEQASAPVTCSIQVLQTDGVTEHLADYQIDLNKPVSEVFGKKGQVGKGYEVYGAILTKSSKGTIISLLDATKVVGAHVLTRKESDFRVQAPIDNLKFDTLELKCVHGSTK